MTRSDLSIPRPVPEPRREPLPNPQPDQPDDLPDSERIGFDAIPGALADGWRDFRRAPAFGLLFSAFYVAGGLVLATVATASGQDWWLIPFIAGFPLIAPFAAVGLYDVSRRIEAAEPLDWRAVIRVVFAQRNRQIPSMAMVILLLFMFWVFVAHTVFALFMGVSALTNITSSPEVMLQGRGLLMLLIGTLIGGGFAAVLFCITVVGLPLLLEHEVDFVTAIIASFRAVGQNPLVMLLWGAVIAGLLLLAILPLFLGLFIALPVLGHASWHMYRRLMP
ncbi:Uncharacterized membrane protein [Paracoccus alcaliphilus]|uniref:Uncharacterized membrane protein n=1 Tax=Paracoccus alcaliphilus TaxID=34002 RepID=A0A1H8JPU4_9RHOB|nr:DUF2189 domain-containing protein [Paracoccus alcaliphilus]WCR19479.1 DUF2189 domain-containing protein [Paracoccus alcaliphilus]SEN82208.1 Uncharacterized membrane protein [Paracoccus alcaliphilus]